MNPRNRLFDITSSIKKVSALLKPLLFAIIFLLYSIQILAQEGYVTGAIKSQDQTVLPFATVTLLAQADSSQVRGGFADESGVFRMKNIPYGHYLLSITNVGFASVYTGSFELGAANEKYDAGTIVLTKNTTTLKELEVKSSKPVLEKRADRFIMNVSASTYQSTDLLNIFKALPFMDVDVNGVTINGKTNVLVMVDNVPRPKETLSTVFESMTGQDIEKIEFITNPSAQYDGTADAVINIITRKGQLLGLTGSVKAGFSQGIYANGNAGISFTERKKNLVISGTINYNDGDFLAQNYGYRVLALQSKNIVLNETPWDLYKIRTFSGVLSIEYVLNKNHTIGAQVDGNFRRMLDGTRWNNKIAFSQAIGGQADSVLIGLQRAHSKTNIENYSINYKAKLDGTGKRISATVIYTPVDKRTLNEMQYQNVVDPSGNILTERPVVRNTNPSNSAIVVTQADAQLPFKNQWELDAGVKLNFSRLRSDPYQELRELDRTWSLIPELSFNNLYRERILAGYIGIQKVFGNFSVNAAVRGEKTMMSVKGIYERNFTDLFPSILLEQTFSKNYKMAFNYKRTINRPSFVELTPYRNYLDDYTVLAGNPALKPQYTDLINVNAGIMDKFFIDLDYTYSKNGFSQLPIQRSDTTVWQMINLNAKNYIVTLNYNYHFFSWWQGSCMLRGSYYKTEGLLDKELVANDGLALIAGVNGTFSLPYDLKLDLSYNYRTPRPYGLAVSRERSFARMALKGNLIQKRLQYTITFSDIFKDDISGFNLKTSNLQSRFYTFSDSRRIGIGFVYTLGKRTVKEATDKKLENEELLNRAK